MSKIGLTTDLRRRMADLQTANPLPLHLEGMAIHLSVAGAQRHEVALHRKYRRYHVRGE
jgi:Meiotically up-regulated gene 113